MSDLYHSAAPRFWNGEFKDAFPAPLQLNPYHDWRETEGHPMSATEIDTWNQLKVLIGVIIVVGGGGFAWTHFDISDLKTELHGTRSDLTMAIGDVAKQAAAANAKSDVLITQINGTNQRLDTLIDQGRKR